MTSKEEIIKKYGVAPKIEAFTPNSLDDHSRTSTRSGLVWDQAWLYTIVASADGQKYVLIRGYEKALTGMWLSSKLNADILKVSPRVFKSLYTGPLYFDLDDDKQMARIKSWPSKHNFTIDLYTDHITWQEENAALDLEWKALGPAMRLTDSGSKDHEGLIYTSEMFEVKGRLNGIEVSGLGGLDQAWLPPGIGWTQCKTYNYIQNCWIPWATRYDDGSLEYGVNATGDGDWHWAFLVQDGKPYIDQNNSLELKFEQAGDARVPIEANIQHGDKRFKWVADGRADIIKGNMNWVSGKMTNENKKAVPLETFAWNEFRSENR